jgi:branched-chain amino acid transport system substrate-binding protein
MARTGRLLALLTVGFTLLGCPRGGPTKIGAVLPLTGSAAVYGQAIRKGIDLAFEQARQNPDAPKVDLVVVDSRSDPDEAKKGLRQVYDDGAIVAIGGVTSAEALAMVPVADNESRVLLSPSASLPQLSGISTNFYRIYPSDFAEGTVMARYAYDTLHLHTGVVLAKSETYAKGIQQVFAEEFQHKGGKILETIEFPANTSDFAALADRVVVLKPDFAYVAAYAEEISNLIQDLRKHNYQGLILTTSSFAAASTIAETGDAAEGTYFTQTSFNPEAAHAADNVKAFVDAFKAKYGEVPDLYAAHGYDAFNILLEAMKQGGTSGVSFWKGMRGIREYPGVTGPLQFDEKGDVQKFPHVYIVREGKAIDVEEERQRQIDAARQEMERLQHELDKLKNQGRN